jgi:hypothetical protein
LFALTVPFALHARAREGSPVYYQNQYQPQYQQAVASAPAQNVYVGSAPVRQVVGQRTYSYQANQASQGPLAGLLSGLGGGLGGANAGGQMTPNGVAVPPSMAQTDISIKAELVRRFADFEFKTGVNSILEWDNMVLTEIALHGEKNFVVRDFDLFVLGEYRRGTVSGPGRSMDYDLEPYDYSQPEYGIFTISIGGQSGTAQTMKLGLGARNVWDLNGWKLSPSIGYQIFKHDLKMNDHIYPNPAVLIPLMTPNGDYVYANNSGAYGVAAPGEAVPEDWFQVCMSPEDLALAAVDATGLPVLVDNTLLTTEYNPLPGYEYLPWGVGPGECVIIGGDGMIVVDGTTHIYNTTWSGIYLGLEIEKQMTYVDKLRFYLQVSMPHYKSEGTWPNRTDWQQNPSFIDEGDSGALHYQAEMEYVYQFSDRLQLSLKASMDYFNVGKIAGKLFVAAYDYYETDSEGYLICQDVGTGMTGTQYCETGGIPIISRQPAYTEHVADSLLYATWRSFALHLGARYAF